MYVLQQYILFSEITVTLDYCILKHTKQRFSLFSYLDWNKDCRKWKKRCGQKCTTRRCMWERWMAPSKSSSSSQKPIWGLRSGKMSFPTPPTFCRQGQDALKQPKRGEIEEHGHRQRRAGQTQPTLTLQLTVVRIMYFKKSRAKMCSIQILWSHRKEGVAMWGWVAVAKRNASSEVINLFNTCTWRTATPSFNVVNGNNSVIRDQGCMAEQKNIYIEELI